MIPTHDLNAAAPVIVSGTQLSKRFGARDAVCDLSLSVRHGHAFGLLGPNGAGKTTTIRLLTGLLTPSSGSVALFGEPMSSQNADRLRARVGVQTETSLYESLTVGENLAIWAALFGIERRCVANRVAEILAIFGLSDRKKAKVGTLSKGMRQKLAVGRAILHRPDLLFLDEPTAGLDPEAAAELIAHLKEMIATNETTVVISTHQLHGLEALCDDIGIIKEGRLLASGRVPELLAGHWPRRRYHVEVTGELARARELLTPVAGVDSVRVIDGGLAVETTDETSIQHAVTTLVNNYFGVRAVIPRIPTIEDFYFATIAAYEVAA